MAATPLHKAQEQLGRLGKSKGNPSKLAQSIIKSGIECHSQKQLFRGREVSKNKNDQEMPPGVDGGSRHDEISRDAVGVSQT